MIGVFPRIPKAFEEGLKVEGERMRAYRGSALQALSWEFRTRKGLGGRTTVYPRSFSFALSHYMAKTFRLLEKNLHRLRQFRLIFRILCYFSRFTSEIKGKKHKMRLIDYCFRPEIRFFALGKQAAEGRKLQFRATAWSCLFAQRHSKGQLHPWLLGSRH